MAIADTFYRDESAKGAQPKDRPEIRYAKVDGPPPDWVGLRIFDVDTGEEIMEVVEVDCDDGWLIRFKPGSDGKIYSCDEKDCSCVGDDLDPNGHIATEKLHGRFRIERPE